mmetsp:Transcript_551/g.1526  ORF Transcript_551/g.1526 Transcript_551/m.1526 type:complete len:233 (+) Transcript_551:392-1090(+)
MASGALDRAVMSMGPGRVHRVAGRAAPLPAPRGAAPKDEPVTEVWRAIRAVAERPVLRNGRHGPCPHDDTPDRSQRLVRRFAPESARVRHVKSLRVVLRACEDEGLDACRVVAQRATECARRTRANRRSAQDLAHHGRNLHHTWDHALLLVRGQAADDAGAGDGALLAPLLRKGAVPVHARDLEISQKRAEQASRSGTWVPSARSRAIPMKHFLGHLAVELAFVTRAHTRAL